LRLCFINLGYRQWSNAGGAAWCQSEDGSYGKEGPPRMERIYHHFETSGLRLQ